MVAGIQGGQQANPFLNTGQVNNGDQGQGVAKADGAGKSKPPGGAATFAQNDVGAQKADQAFGKINQGPENAEGKGLNLQA